MTTMSSPSHSQDDDPYHLYLQQVMQIVRITVNSEGTDETIGNLSKYKTNHHHNILKLLDPLTFCDNSTVGLDEETIRKYIREQDGKE
jgi:hypothetical protein